jgi:molecular chaperone GrpE
MKKKSNLHKETAKEDNIESFDNKENMILNDNKNEEAAYNSNEVKNTEPAKNADIIEQELNETIAKLAEMQDKYLRLSAEFDNYRKRTLKEKMEISKYASEDILLKILPFMDDFDRALKHLNESTDYEGMKSGIELIYSKFGDFLKQNEVKEIEALNSNFDVDIHEAVAKSPAEEKMKGKIVDVVLKGYYLQDKVLRFAKVVVGE